MDLWLGADKIRERASKPSAYELTEALFLRLLGLVYLSAFASFWPQIIGLFGARGIVPITRIMQGLRLELGASAFYQIPSLFWLKSSDSALLGCCILGCFAALLLTAGVLSRITAAVCWALYLSIVCVGEPFTGFQWDALLLEAGFLALFAGAPWLVWAYRFLLFRLMFESGAVKLLSGDPNWRNLHALRFHFLSQPLPNPVAYYAYRLPGWLLDGMTASTLALEFAVPFLLFARRRLRYTGVGALMFLQLVIILTGNYAFFNLLTLALCFWGLDDQVFAPLAPFLRRTFLRIPFPTRMFVSLRVAGNGVLAVILILGALQLVSMFSPRAVRFAARAFALIGPFEIVNTYGLFATMTTVRQELIIEGSNDQADWREYSFRYKPGELHRPLPQIAPYQPRLDWQMWFAALSDLPENPWLRNLLYRLMTGEPSVLGLLEPAPFPKPPRYIRVLIYEYRFTTPTERARTGAVWQRELKGTWLGVVSLSGS